MHFFAPRPFFFAPFLIGFGLLKIALFVILIVLIVRLVSGHRRPMFAHHGPGYWQAPVQEQDPRRVAAMRYATGQIGKDEFERIVAGLDAAQQRPTEPMPPVES